MTAKFATATHYEGNTLSGLLFVSHPHHAQPERVQFEISRSTRTVLTSTYHAETECAMTNNNHFQYLVLV